MDLFTYTDQVRDHLDKMQDAAIALCESLRATAGFSFFQQGHEVEPDTEARIDRICQALLSWDYPPPGEQEPALVIGCAAVGEPTLVLAGVLNHHKRRWERLHRKIRREAAEDAMLQTNGNSAEVWATKQMRQLLKLSGRGNLDLDATDRIVPVLPGPAYRINWHRARSSASRSVTLAEVIQALKALMQEVGTDSPLYDAAENDLHCLGGLPETTAVAYRAKAPVTSVRFRASYVLGRQKVPAITRYASNPVLFAHGGEAPEIIAFAPVHTTTGAGRPSSVSNERVSSVLGQYFWYLQSPAKKKTPLKTRTQNPFAVTAYPGLWLGTRKRAKSLTALVMVKPVDRPATSVSIDRLGLSAAWRKAAELYIMGRSAKLSAVIEAEPAASQVQNLLHWAQLHS